MGNSQPRPSKDYISYKYRKHRSRPIYIAHVILGNKTIKKNFKRQEDAQKWIDLIRSKIDSGDQTVIQMINSY